MKTRSVLFAISVLFVTACEKSDSGSNVSGSGAGIYGIWRMPDNHSGEDRLMKIERNQVTGIVTCPQPDGGAPVQASVTVPAEVTERTFRILQDSDREVPSANGSVCYVSISAMDSALAWEVKSGKLLLKDTDPKHNGTTFEYPRAQ